MHSEKVFQCDFFLTQNSRRLNRRAAFGYSENAYAIRMTAAALWARAIAHVDLDQFYAAVEILDFPEFKGLPLIVGGAPGKRGVVSTASYEARTFGVHSAMASTQAAKLCPQAVWRLPRMERYAEISKQIHAVFARFTDLIEPLSLDEAFLDLTGSQRLFGAPPEIARQIKAAILDELKLVASVGVAENKFLAKVASDLRKPDALVVVEPGAANARKFLAPLPVSRLWGVGPKSAARLADLGLRTIADIANAPPKLLEKQLGPAAAEHLGALSIGDDRRDVEVGGRPKSVGRENTFAEDLRDYAAMERELLYFAEDVSSRLRARKLKALGVTLKVRFGDFTTLSRQATFSEPTDISDELYATAVALLRKVDFGRQGARLLGISAHKFFGVGEWTKGLFEDERAARRSRAALAVDRLRGRFGDDAVLRGGLLSGRSENTGSANDRPAQ